MTHLTNTVNIDETWLFVRRKYRLFTNVTRSLINCRVEFNIEEDANSAYDDTETTKLAPNFKKKVRMTKKTD